MSKKHVFINDYGLSNFHNAISLVESGYRVPVLMYNANYTEQYYKTLGIETLMITERESQIYDFCLNEEVDIFINVNPQHAGAYGRIQQFDGEIEFLGLYGNRSKLK